MSPKVLLNVSDELLLNSWPCGRKKNSPDLVQVGAVLTTRQKESMHLTYCTLVQFAVGTPPPPNPASKSSTLGRGAAVDAFKVLPATHAGLLTL